MSITAAGKRAGRQSGRFQKNACRMNRNRKPELPFRGGSGCNRSGISG